jgi:hypothetical protein
LYTATSWTTVIFTATAVTGSNLADLDLYRKGKVLPALFHEDVWENGFGGE